MADHSAKSRHPSVSRAYTFISDSLVSGVWSEGEVLPSLAALAQSAGVSRHTMWKAIQLLKREGSCTVIERGRIIAGSRQPRADTADAAGNLLWKRKRILLEQDLVSGRFPEREAIPSIGELRSIYGTSYTTVRKILDSLIADHVLVPYGKSYRSALGAARLRPKTLTVISGEKIPQMVRRHESIIVRIFETLQADCIRRGIDVELINLEFPDTSSPEAYAGMIPDRDDGIGYITLVDVAADEPKFFALLEMLSRRKEPVAIFDTSNKFRLPFRLAIHPNLQVVKIASLTAGRDAANVLLNQGHSRIAFISLFHANEWSIDRLAGLKRRCGRAGNNQGIVEHVSTEYRYAQDAVQQFSGIEKPTLRGQRAKTGRHGGMPGQEEKNHEDGLIRQVKADLAAVRRLSGEPLTPALSARLRNILFEHAGDSLIALHLQPLLQQALDDRAASAWVMANDIQAIVALDFLARMNIRVPGDLSVVSFDNTIDAMERGLTSYDFNPRAIVYRMLSFIMQPRVFYSRRPVEVAGVMVERGTVGAPFYTVS